MRWDGGSYGDPSDRKLDSETLYGSLPLATGEGRNATLPPANQNHTPAGSDVVSARRRLVRVRS